MEKKSVKFDSQISDSIEFIEDANNSEEESRFRAQAGNLLKRFVNDKKKVLKTVWNKTG